MVDVLPQAFDVSIYRELHADLRGMSDEELVRHYDEFGRDEGRRCSAVQSRADFISLVPTSARSLEIGPFAAPVLTGPNVTYCDVLDTAGLRVRAGEHGLDPAAVPPIDHVLGDDQLDGIPGRFDVVLTSHAIEHQPDLVEHLQQVRRRLEPDGRYVAMIPDKRYCFDRDIAPSTIAEVVSAHRERRRRHTLRSVIEHRSLTVHNDSGTHWNERLVRHRPSTDAEAVRRAIEEFDDANGNYIDVHAWYFTPDSFVEIIRLLYALELIDLEIERLYPTQFSHNEFWTVMRPIRR